MYFPLSCAQLPLSLVAHVAVYCVTLSVSLYMLVTVPLSMYICSVRLCATISSLCGSSKLQLYVGSMYIINPLVIAFCFYGTIVSFPVVSRRELQNQKDSAILYFRGKR